MNARAETEPRGLFERGRDKRTHHGVLFFLFRSFNHRTMVFVGTEDHRTYQGWMWKREFHGASHEAVAREWAERLYAPAEQIAAILESVRGFRYE